MTVVPLRPDGEVRRLRIDQIRRDPRTQPRNHVDHEVAERYRDCLGEGDEFPPVTVFFDGTEYWLADGWHRVCAALCLGWQGIAAEIRPGGLRDAEWHSFSVNATHGYPRDEDDVGRILGRIFRDPEYLAKGLREISRHCSIPLTTVHRRYGKVAASVPPEQMGMKPSTREVVRSGINYEMNTADIGRRAPEFIDNDATWHEPDIPRPGMVREGAAEDFPALRDSLVNGSVQAWEIRLIWPNWPVGNETLNA